MNKQDWQINIENLMASVAEKIGPEAAKAPLIRVGATCFEDLSPCYYDAVFGDLMQMDSDP